MHVLLYPIQLLISPHWSWCVFSDLDPHPVYLTILWTFLPNQIVQRGTCFFDTKFANVVAKGGKAMLVYNKLDNPDVLYLSPPANLSAAFISRSDGLAVSRRRLILQLCRLLINVSSSSIFSKQTPP